MKRSSIKVDVKKQSENCVEVGDVNGYNLKQYDQLYLPLQLLFDL